MEEPRDTAEVRQVERVVIFVDLAGVSSEYNWNYMGEHRISVRQVFSLPEAANALKTQHYCAILFHLDTFSDDVVRFCRMCQSNYHESPRLIASGTLTVEQEERFYDCGVLDVSNANVSSRRFAKKLRACLQALSRDYLHAPIRLGDAIVDLNKREVSRDGRSWQLCGKLTALLSYFIDHPERVVTREKLE